MEKEKEIKKKKRGWGESECVSGADGRDGVGNSSSNIQGKGAGTANVICS